MTDAGGDLAILPLTLERFADLETLFGQGGDPKWCWCSSFRLRAMDFTKANPASNRRVLERAVEVTAKEQRAPGLIAYRGGEAIGWVSLGPRDDYQRLLHSRTHAPIDGRPVWSIVCFVVGRRARGQGVASALIEAAVDYAREHGATLLEGYPVETDGKRIASANAYMGTVSMFERAGFEVVERRQWNPTTVVRPIVRRAIRPRRRPRSR